MPVFFSPCYDDHRDLHSFPTRRSSDLLVHARSYQYVSQGVVGVDDLDQYGQWQQVPDHGWCWSPSGVEAGWRDRKSTRLNSSHVSISYAVFCLKKKKKKYGSRENVRPL